MKHLPSAFGPRRDPENDDHTDLDHANFDQASFSKPLPPLPGNPRIIPREEHSISRRDIDPDALKILYRLIRYGYRAYLVGGGVRDLLLGKKPKDFDISTDARTEKVRGLFRNSRVIGRRFRLNHIYFAGGKVVEVSTFRAYGEGVPGSGSSESLLITEDNTYGDPYSDALRRDLTINGLFYDVSTFSIIDYVGGVEDLNRGVIRFIGEPNVRVQEDPIRMIRAIRHAARTGFVIEEKTYDAICNHRELIRLSAKARLSEELLRELRRGFALESFCLFRHSGLLPLLFPTLSQIIDELGEDAWKKLCGVLSQIDRISKSGKELSPAVLYLGLYIGRITPKLAEELQIGEGSATLELLSSKLFEAEPVEVVQSDESEPVRGRRRGRRRQRGRSGMSSTSVEELRNALFELFKPLGVSRKECEKMEDLLYLRREILRTSPQVWEEILRSTSLRQEVLQLLQITCDDEDERHEYEAFEQIEDEHDHRAERQPHHYRRRRGHRRRR